MFRNSVFYPRVSILLAAASVFLTAADARSQVEADPETSTKQVVTTLGDDDRQTLLQIFQGSVDNVRFQPPIEAEIEAFGKLMDQTLAAESLGDSLIEDWDRQQWTVSRIGNTAIIAIAEHRHHRRGRGMYLVRASGDSSIALQAPHRFYDRKTGVIARKMFEQGGFRAAGFNTVPRPKIDLAHTAQHHFNAFTRSLLAAQNDMRIVQLHGFKNGNKTNAGKTAEIIVSDTTRFPGRVARRIALELKTAFGKDRALLYPIDTKWLGGTRNAQSRVVQDFGSTGFIHIEMNADLRQRLAGDASERAVFHASILEGCRGTR